ncbi:hypothetical protein ACKWTF_015404 [Chironomus riparius]
MKFFIICLFLTLSITNQVASQTQSSSDNFTLKSLLIGFFKNIDTNSVDQRNNFARIFENANRTCMLEKLLMTDDSQDMEIQIQDEIFYDLTNLRKLSVLTIALEVCKNDNSNFESVKFLKEALKSQEVDENVLKCAEMKLFSQNNEFSESCDKILDNFYQIYSTFDHKAVAGPVESFGFNKCVDLIQKLSKNSFYHLLLAGYGELNEEQMESIIKNFNTEKTLRYDKMLRCMQRELKLKNIF